MGESDLHKRRLEASKSKNEYIRDPFCWARVWGDNWVPYLMGLFINSIIWIQNFIVTCWRNSFIGVLIISAGYFGILIITTSYLHNKIELLSNILIKGWDDRRNFGFSIAGIIGGWLALLGLYFSAKRTRALDDDNRIKLNASRQNNFLEAVNLLKDESPFVVAGAIEGLRKLGTEPDARYFSDSVHFLAAFIRETSNPLNNSAETPSTKSQSSSKQKSRNSQINVSFTNIQNAFGAIVSIINDHNDTTYRKNFEGWFINLSNSSLEDIQVLSGSILRNLNLSLCNLKSAYMDSCVFIKTNFYDTDLSDANFTNAMFDSLNYSMIFKAKMDRTIISGCIFIK